MQCHPERLCGECRQRNWGSLQHCPGSPIHREKWDEFPLQQRAQIGTAPLVFGQKGMCSRQCSDPAVDCANIRGHVHRPRQPECGLHHREGILRTVVHLPREQRLALLLRAPLMRVLHDADPLFDGFIGATADGDSLGADPAPIVCCPGSTDAELDIERPLRQACLGPEADRLLSILGVNRLEPAVPAHASAR